VTKQQLSEIRRKAGRKGGKAKHKRRGLQGVKSKDRKAISKLGHDARWGSAGGK